jgi:hypothetical protein
MRAGISRPYIWTTDQVAAAAIESEDIADAAVTAAKLAAAAVETDKIKDLAITTGKIADLAVSAAKLAADAVETAKIKDLAVSTGKIADLAVVEKKIADNCIGVGKLGPTLTQCRAKAYRSTTQSYGASTHTKVQFDTEVFDFLNHYNNTTNYRYTVASGYNGQYVVHAHVTFPTATSNLQPWLEIYVNGSAVQISYLHQISGNGVLTGEIMGIMNLVAGDYVEIYIYSTVAGSIQAGSDKTYFEIFRLP